MVTSKVEGVGLHEPVQMSVYTSQAVMRLSIPSCPHQSLYNVTWTYGLQPYAQTSLKIFYVYVYVCVSVCCACVGARGAQLELENSRQP